MAFIKSECGFIAKVSIIMATRMLGLFMILPVFVIYANSYEHANALLIGIAIGIYGLTQALLQIPFGYFSDKFGRKPLLIIGLVIFAIGSLIAALSENIYLVILGRIIAGSGAIASVLMAFVADVVAAENRSKANAILGMQIGVAFMLAIVVAPAFAAQFGLDGIFYFTTLLAIIGLFVVMTLPKERKQPQYIFNIANIKQILTQKLLAFDFSIFALHFILTAIFITIPTQLADFNTSWLYLGVFVVSFLVMVPFIIIAEKRKKHKQVVVFAVLLLLLTQVLLYFGISIYATIILLTAFFVAFNLVESLLPSIIARWSDKNNPQKRGLIMSFYSTAQFFGAFNGGIIAGFLSYNFDDNAIFIVNGVIATIWFLIILRKKVWQE